MAFGMNGWMRSPAVLTTLAVCDRISVYFRKDRVRVAATQELACCLATYHFFKKWWRRSIGTLFFSSCVWQSNWYYYHQSAEVWEETPTTVVLWFPKIALWWGLACNPAWLQSLSESSCHPTALFVKGESPAPWGVVSPSGVSKVYQADRWSGAWGHKLAWLWAELQHWCQNQADWRFHANAISQVDQLQQGLKKQKHFLKSVVTNSISR